jgi:hypothetical protein
MFLFLSIAIEDIISYAAIMLAKLPYANSVNVNYRHVYKRSSCNLLMIGRPSRITVYGHDV